MTFTGYSHVSITVTDLDKSRTWYSNVLGWTPMMEGRTDTTTYAIGTLSEGAMVVLRVHDTPIGDHFDERRPGLDHVSFGVEAESDLHELEERLRSANATFTPAQDVGYAQVLTFRDPDNIALEAFFTK